MTHQCFWSGKIGNLIEESSYNTKGPRGSFSNLNHWERNWCWITASTWKSCKSWKFLLKPLLLEQLSLLFLLKAASISRHVWYWLDSAAKSYKYRCDLESIIFGSICGHFNSSLTSSKQFNSTAIPKKNYKYWAYSAYLMEWFFSCFGRDCERWSQQLLTTAAPSRYSS